MEHNLVPPFIIREAGVAVDDTPKIHAASPTVQHYSIFFEEDNLRIPLALHGVFSYFPTILPSAHNMSDTLSILHLNPNVLIYNPRSEAYARSEQNMQDFQGNLVPNT